MRSGFRTRLADYLTKDEAPALIHFGIGRTEQWLLVRLQDPENTSSSFFKTGTSDETSL